MEGIVERLRLQESVGLLRTPSGHRHVTYGEAADHIEQLEARVKELEGGLELALQYGWEPARALLAKAAAQADDRS